MGGGSHDVRAAHVVGACFVVVGPLGLVGSGTGEICLFVAAVNIPAEWGTLRNALPLAGDPPYYALFFEDAGGNIRIVPLYLTLGAGIWQLSLRRDPVVVIKRGP